MFKNMPSNVKNFILKDLCVFPTVFNFFLNFGFAYAFFHTVKMIPFAGQKGFMFDVVIYVSLTALFNGMDAGNKVKKAFDKKTIEPLYIEKSQRGVLQYLSDKEPIKGLQVGLLIGLVIVGAVYLLCPLLGVNEIEFWTYAFIKGISASCIAFLATFITAVQAIYKNK